MSGGTSPWTADTDGGGESDLSEIASGRDARSPGDDAEFPAVMVVVEPRDGNVLAVSTVTSDGSGQVRLSRVDGDATVDLGLHPGSGSTIEDGPLPPGDYIYRAVVIGAGGEVSAPSMVGPYLPLADATPPRTRIIINEGTWNTNQRAVSVQFSDLSEPVLDMRLAESLGDLATSGWVPFSPITSFMLGDAQGEHTIYAQLRNAEGLVSEPASAAIDLDSIAPVSMVGALDVSYASGPVDIPFTASDELSGLAEVALWWRHSDDHGVTWTTWQPGPTSTMSPVSFAFGAGSGQYEFYSVAVDAAGNHEAPPSVADAVTTFGDVNPPASAAGPLDAVVTASTLDLPFVASDDASGVDQVELWSRYRVNESRPWSTWAMAGTAASSPITFSFGAGDGRYEFYTIAIDGAGNREAPPPTGDAETHRDAVDDPPDFRVALSATRQVETCPLGHICPNIIVPLPPPVQLEGTGIAADDRDDIVALEYRVYGVAANGHANRLTDYVDLDLDDGSLDGRVEEFSLSDGFRDNSYVALDVQIRVKAKNKTTTRTIRVNVNPVCNQIDPNCTT